MNEILLAEWVSVKDGLPPFDKKIWFRGVVNWRKEDNARHFEDTLTMETEELEYGQTGYLLKDNTDFVVTDSIFPIEDIASEFITHWLRPLPNHVAISVERLEALENAEKAYDKLYEDFKQICDYDEKLREENKRYRNALNEAENKLQQ